MFLKIEYRRGDERIGVVKVPHAALSEELKEGNSSEEIRNILIKITAPIIHFESTMGPLMVGDELFINDEFNCILSSDDIQNIVERGCDSNEVDPETLDPEILEQLKISEQEVKEEELFEEFKENFFKLDMNGQAEVLKRTPIEFRKFMLDHLNPVFDPESDLEEQKSSFESWKKEILEAPEVEFEDTE